MIISEYNQHLFSREMEIAAKIRHPNLLLFIGATREGEAVILTELMPTSLRRELETELPPRYRHQYLIIAQDVACGSAKVFTPVEALPDLHVSQHAGQAGLLTSTPPHQGHHGCPLDLQDLSLSLCWTLLRKPEHTSLPSKTP